MKLNEVTSIPTTALTNPTRMKSPEITNNFLKRGLGRDPELIGQGSQADAYASRDEPGTVRRVARTSRDQKDGYRAWLHALLTDQRFLNNPYFPKIFGVKSFTDSKGNHGYAVDMERLQPFLDLSDEEALDLGRKLYDGFDNVFLRRPQWLDKRRLVRQKPLDALIQMLDSLSYQSVDPASFANIKDGQLKKALHLIRSRIKFGLANDIHKGNVMVRRGRFAPQLVFTDPLI